MHYILIIAVITIIVIIQIRSFISTKEKLAGFENVFAEDGKAYGLQTENLIEAIRQGKWDEHSAMLKTLGIDIEDYVYTKADEAGVEQRFYYRDELIDLLIDNVKQTNKIETSHSNGILATIFNSINNYLANNKGKDFYLMKDIVDRNCDAAEEEIQMQIPVPLYLGLAGTMMGILIGVGFLVASGSLDALLGEGKADSAEGVKTLLGGVAIAMASSICGIILTTWGSNKAKTAKAKVEHNKNTFLSWLQAKLLPTMDDSITHTLETMTANLTGFNKTFTDNTTNLGTALAKVNESYKLQTELIQAVNQMRAGNVTQVNVALLGKLVECSSHIGKLGEYLQHTNDYLANVKVLNEKLDAGEQRAKAIEEMAVFFKNEISQVEQRKEAISKAVGTIDSILEERLRKLADHAGENVENFYKALGKQQDALQKKLEETETVVSELKNLSAIKESIAKFEKATSEQNRKLDSLANAIRALATKGTNIPEITSNPRMPIRKKFLIGSLSVVVGFLLLALLIANWGAIYYVINLFRFK